MTDLIVYEENGILWASIDRQNKAGSISREVTDGYIEAVARVTKDPSLKGLIWTSESSTLFSGGVDLKVPQGFNEQQASEWRTAIIVDLIHATLSCPRPIVTMTRGRLLGGAFLNALSCDRIVAASGATFKLPEVQIGIGSPIAAVVVEGATNAGLAYDFLLSARNIPAEELESKGGPCTVVPEEVLRDAAIATIENLASMPSEAFGYMKNWFQKPRIAALDEAILYTNKTRKGKNDEVNAIVNQFFK